MLPGADAAAIDCARPAMPGTDRQVLDIVNFLPDATFVIDSAGRVVAWNPAIEAMTGVPREEMLGRGDHAYALPFYGECRPILIDLVANGDSEWTSRYTFLRKRRGAIDAEAYLSRWNDGRGAYVWGTASPLLDRRGRAAGAIESIRDITSRRRAEEDRARLLAAVEQLPDSMLLADRTGTIIYVNAALEAMFGYAREELVGRSIAALAAAGGIGPDDALRAALGGQRWSGDLSVRAKDSQFLDVEWSTAPLHGDTDDVVGYVGIARDRSAERALEARLAQAEKMEAVGRLAGGVAHDFNNLLTVIGGFAEMLLADLAEGDPRRMDAQEIREAAGRGASLTQRLLAFSRRQDVRPERLDLGEFVAGAVPILRRLVGEDIEIVIEREPDLPAVLVDRAQVEHVLLNLASNARDAMPEGGTLRVEVATVHLDDAFARRHPGARTGEHVRLLVADTGVGMTRETLTHVFEPFFTTKDPGRGTGLGLASVYGAVKQANGFIHVGSRRGRGTTFRIHLPAVPGEPEVRLARTAEDRPSGRSTPGTQTVLLVEDQAPVREFARRTLERHGYRTIACESAADALRVAGDDAAPLAALVTDVVMPLMSGPVLADRVRSLRPGLPVLFVTSHAGARLAGRSDPSLAKPFTGGQLAQAVAELIGSERRPDPAI